MSQEQIIKEFYSPVKLVDTTEILSNAEMNLMPYNSKAVVVSPPEGGEKVVSFCSDTYGLVKNEEIFPEIEKLLGEQFTFSKKYRHWNFAKFYVDYEIQGKETYIGNAKFADEVRPTIRIMHSYNGQLRYSAVMGFRRQICSNGLWGYVYETDFILKHTTNNLQNIFQKTMEGVVNFIDKVEDFKLKYELLTERNVINLEERVDQVLEKVKIFPKRQRELVIERAHQEHNTNGLPINDWLIYNAFNYQLNHNEAIKSQDDQKMLLDRKIFEVIFKDEKKPELVMA